MASRTQLRLQQLTGSTVDIKSRTLVATAINNAAPGTAAALTGSSVADLFGYVGAALNRIHGADSNEPFNNTAYVLKGGAGNQRINYNHVNNTTIHDGGGSLRFKAADNAEVTIHPSTGGSAIATFANDAFTFAQPSTFESDLTVDGNLTVAGTTTTIDTANLTVEDALIELNKGVVVNTGDAGLLLKRSSAGSNGTASSIVITFTGAFTAGEDIAFESAGGTNLTVTEADTPAAATDSTAQFTNGSNQADSAIGLIAAIEASFAAGGRFRAEAGATNASVVVFAVADTPSTQETGNRVVFSNDSTVSNTSPDTFANGADAQVAGRIGNVSAIYDESADVFKFQFTDSNATDLTVDVKEQQVLPVQIDQLYLSSSADNLAIDTVNLDFQITAANNLDLIVGASDAVTIGSSDSSTSGKLFIEDNDGGEGFSIESPTAIAITGLGVILPSVAGSAGQVLSLDSVSTNKMTLGYASIGSARQALLSGSITGTLAADTLLSTKGKSDASDPTFKLEPISDITVADLKTALTVFVNGQLLLSGAAGDTTAANCDYTMFDSAPIQPTGGVLTYDTGLPTDGEQITLVSFDGVSKTYEVDSGGAENGDIINTDKVAFELGANNDETYANLILAINHENGHNAGNANSVINLVHTNGGDANQVGTLTFSKGSTIVNSQLDSQNDIVIAETLTNVVVTSFTGGVASGFQDVKFAFALEEDDVIQMIIR